MLILGYVMLQPTSLGKGPAQVKKIDKISFLFKINGGEGDQ